MLTLSVVSKSAPASTNSSATDLNPCLAADSNGVHPSYSMFQKGVRGTNEQDIHKQKIYM